eukprot:scaffold4406_cov112-Isochrysis_galbana.AAC.5
MRSDPPVCRLWCGMSPPPSARMPSRISGTFGSSHAAAVPIWEPLPFLEEAGESSRPAKPRTTSKREPAASGRKGCGRKARGFHLTAITSPPCTSYKKRASSP